VWCKGIEAKKSRFSFREGIFSYTSILILNPLENLLRIRISLSILYNNNISIILPHFFNTTFVFLIKRTLKDQDRFGTLDTVSKDGKL
jgi:hypothetical protein